MKQSPRAWNRKLDVFLKNIEFVKSDADFSVHVAQVGNVKFFIVIYVDDLILVCNNKDKLLQVKEELFWKFEMKDLGDGSGKGLCTTSLHQPNWVSQGDSQTLSHGGLQSHWNAIWSQDKVEEECEQGWWDGESSLSTSRGIFDVWHAMYSAGFGIPNKCGESWLIQA